MGFFIRSKGLSANIPLFYIYTFLNSFYLDRGIWVLFLLSKGFSLTKVGLLEAAYHVAAFLFEVPTGYVADRFGKRASLICGQLLKILSALLLLMGGSSLMLYIGFTLGAVAGTFLSGATGAWVYETMKLTGRESGFKKLNSRLYGIMLVSMGIASPVGGALAGFRWEALYACMALLSACSLLVILQMKDTSHADFHSEGDDHPATGTNADKGESADADEKNPAGQESPAGFIKQLRLSASILRQHPGLRALIGYGALLYAGVTSAGFYVQVLLERNGMPYSLIGSFNGMDTWLGAALGATAYLAERGLRRSGILIFCGAGSIAAVLLLGVCGASSAAVVASYFIMNGLVSLLEPLQEAYLNEYLPSSQRSTLLSFFSMMVSLAMITVFTTLSFLADHYGVRAALLTVGLVWMPFQLWFMIRSVQLSPAHPGTHSSTAGGSITSTATSQPKPSGDR
jgi:MFS family permease